MARTKVKDKLKLKPVDEKKDEETKDPKELFEKFDVDKSGTIDFSEFQEMLKHLQMQMSLPKMLKYFRLCDVDGSGEINFDEFKLALFACDADGNPVGFSPSGLLSPQDAFEMFDKDGSGEIDEEEFYFLLDYLGIKLSDEMQEKMFKKYDKDRSGTIDYNEFKKIWARVSNTRKELEERGIKIPKLSTKSSLIRLLERILDEEEQQEKQALEEAERWRAMQCALKERRHVIAKAKWRSRIELSSALDAGGQVYIFGGGSHDQFNQSLRRSFETNSFTLEGYNLLQELWDMRIGSRSTFSCNQQHQNDMQLREMNGEQKLESASSSKEASSYFQNIMVKKNTAALWGRRPYEVVFSDNVAFAITDFGQIFAWGGNDHWFHEIEYDSFWQTNWRGDTTARSKNLLTTNMKSPQKNSLESEKKLPPVEDTENEKLKKVLQYYGCWEVPNRGDIKALVSNIPLDHVRLSIKLRGKLSDGLSKLDMISILHNDFKLEQRVLGERTHHKIRDLESEILNLTAQKKKSMAKRLCLEVSDLWSPLHDIQTKEKTETMEREKERILNKRKKLETDYSCYQKHLKNRKVKEHQKDSKYYPNNINGITHRGPKIQTPRDGSCSKRIFAGTNHACLINEKGNLYSWGTDIGGRLGLNDEKTICKSVAAEINQPTLVNAFQGNRVINCSLGRSHSAAIDEAGHLYIWGSYQTGKLGFGDSFLKSLEKYCGIPKRLVIPTCLKILNVSCGTSHTACVGSGGELYVWGCGDGGRLGIGDLATYYKPRLVEDLLHEKIADVSCGHYQTLVLTVIFSEMSGQGQGIFKKVFGGKLYVAGPRNVLGFDAPKFQQYESLKSAKNEVLIKQISAGFLHQSAVTYDGELLCWGNNRKGCCGQPLSILFISKPTVVKCLYEKEQNLALGKSYRQSSVYSEQDAHLAANCCTDGKITKGIHTAFDPQPFWEVDLGDDAFIGKIKLWNCIDEPNDPTLDRDTFTRRLFPCWIMVSNLPFPGGVGGDNLKKSLDVSEARYRFTDIKRLSTWKVPKNTSARYLRVQLEQMNFLHFSELEVFGIFGSSESIGKISFSSCGKDVTAAVVRAKESDILTSFQRASSADYYNEIVLRQLETFTEVYENSSGGRKTPNTCVLCSGGKICEICKLKQTYKDELITQGYQRQLSEIENILLSIKKTLTI